MSNQQKIKAVRGYIKHACKAALDNPHTVTAKLFFKEYEHVMKAGSRQSKRCYIVATRDLLNKEILPNA